MVKTYFRDCVRWSFLFEEGSVFTRYVSGKRPINQIKGRIHFGYNNKVKYGCAWRRNEGKVMDYGTKTDDLDSLQHMKFKGEDITLYVLKRGDIVEKKVPSSELDKILTHDKKQQYVVKEFLPSIRYTALGRNAKYYMLLELDGFRKILPLKKHRIGMPYDHTYLFGFEIDGRCFVVNRKCKDTMSESKVNAFSLKEFKQFVKNILHELVEIQRLNLAHTDIKLDNIMKCGTKYELIDWENSRTITYENMNHLGLSPLYYKTKFGIAWRPAFEAALLVYYKVTGGYDTGTYMSSRYAKELIEYYYTLFHEPDEMVFEKVKYELDLTAFGMILYGIIQRNPNVPKKYTSFVMNIYKMKNASNALRNFTKLDSKTRKKI